MITYGRNINGRVVMPGEAISFPAFAYSRPLLAPTNRRLPVVSGGDQPGETLTVSPGSWAANPGANVSWSWEADTVPNGATGPSYVIQAGDVGKAIRVRETAVNSQGTSSAPSNSITVLAP